LRPASAGVETHGGCEGDGLGYVERAAGAHGGGGEIVPAAQIFDGDIEAIGDGDECVARAHAVALRVDGGGASGDGDDELVTCLEWRADGDAVGFGDLAWLGV